MPTLENLASRYHSQRLLVLEVGMGKSIAGAHGSLHGAKSNLHRPTASIYASLRRNTLHFRWAIRLCYPFWRQMPPKTDQASSLARSIPWKEKYVVPSLEVPRSRREVLGSLYAQDYLCVVGDLPSVSCLHSIIADPQGLNGLVLVPNA